MNTRMKSKVRSIIKYSIALAVGFSVGYIVSARNEKEKYLYSFDSQTSIRMVDDLYALNSLQNGDVDSAIKRLHANVFGSLVGWDSTGMIEELIEREPESSPYLKDMYKALSLAGEYNQKYHSPKVADSYNEILSKYNTHNK